MSQYYSVQKPVKFYIYTLLSLKEHEFYTGLTTDLKTRLEEHARGMVSSTRIRIPFKMIHYEYFVNYDDAYARQKYLKSNLGKAKLKQSLKKTLSRLNPYNFRY
jgi:putative endonuclease